jgi:hypothetical protein
MQSCFNSVAVYCMRACSAAVYCLRARDKSRQAKLAVGRYAPRFHGKKL